LCNCQIEEDKIGISMFLALILLFIKRFLLLLFVMAAAAGDFIIYHKLWYSRFKKVNDSQVRAKLNGRKSA
jgi:hypothetical protein